MFIRGLRRLQIRSSWGSDRSVHHGSCQTNLKHGSCCDLPYGLVAGSRVRVLRLLLNVYPADLGLVVAFGVRVCSCTSAIVVCVCVF